MPPIVTRPLKWGICSSFALVVASAAIARNDVPGAPANPDLQRHWRPAFEVVLPSGVASDDLKPRCWAQPALDSYVTEGRLWIEAIYGLPHGYVETHCLREQLSKVNASLNMSYRTLLRSLRPAERAKIVASQRLWIIRRNRNCNVDDGVTYLMLGSFVCLMNMTSDRLDWIESR